MICENKLGKINVCENNIITFRKGLIGLEYLKKFTLIDNPSSSPEEPSLFKWLLSLEEPSKTFVVVDPWVIKPDYSFEIGKDIRKELKINKEDKPLVLSIAVVDEEAENSTINLKAPIIINPIFRIGLQLILDNEHYPIRYKIFYK